MKSPIFAKKVFHQAKLAITATALLHPIASFSTDIIAVGARYREDSEITEGVEEGEIEGIKYRIHHKDGSGTFEGIDGTYWSVGCNRDSMNDKATCHMNRGDLWIFIQPSGEPFVTIGNKHYPGSEVAFRIDNSSPITASARSEGIFDKRSSSTIVRQLANGENYRTRFMKWPHRYWVEGGESTRGFKQVHDYVKWVTQIANKLRPSNNSKH